MFPLWQSLDIVAKSWNTTEEDKAPRESDRMTPSKIGQTCSCKVNVKLIFSATSDLKNLEIQSNSYNLSQENVVS